MNLRAEGAGSFTDLTPQPPSPLHPLPRASFRALVATWVADDSDEALALLPEWKAFREILRA